jgi:hypothetical protein
MSEKKNFRPKATNILRSCSLDLMSHYYCECDDIAFMTSLFVSYIYCWRSSSTSHNGVDGDELANALA